MSFILRKKGYEQWARFEKKGKGEKSFYHISWVGIDKATSFPSIKDLESTFATAYDEMNKAAEIKSAAINAKGGVKEKSLYRHQFAYSNKEPVDPFTDFGDRPPLTTDIMIERIKDSYQFGSKSGFNTYDEKTRKRISYSSNDLISGKVPPEHVKLIFQECGYIWRETTAAEYLPNWHSDISDPTNFLKQHCLIESQIKSESLLEAQTAYFVRSPSGWLGERKSVLMFLPQMQQATLFYTADSAKAAILSTTGYGNVRIEHCALIKTQLVITEVEPAYPKDSKHLNDQEAAHLHAGCEALQISSLIASATAQRQEALAAGQKNPSESATAEETTAPTPRRNRI